MQNISGKLMHLSLFELSSFLPACGARAVSPLRARQELTHGSPGNVAHRNAFWVRCHRMPKLCRSAQGNVQQKDAKEAYVRVCLWFQCVIT